MNVSICNWKSPFPKEENLYADAWVGGDQKDPSIFLIFKYVNKQDFLISNMVTKIVNDLCTGLKIWFEVGLSCGLGFTFFDLPYLPGF